MSNKVTGKQDPEKPREESSKADKRPVTVANVTVNPQNMASRGTLAILVGTIEKKGSSEREG